MPTKEEKMVDLDTSGEGAEINLEEQKDESVVDTEAPKKEIEVKETDEENKETNQEYNSDQEAEDDINDVNTATKREDVTRSVKIKVAKMPSLGAASDKDE